MDLIRALILRLEELPIETGDTRTVQSGCTELVGIVGSNEAVNYHLNLLRDAGFLNCPSSGQPDFGISYKGLTWVGHDLADAVRGKSALQRDLPEPVGDRARSSNTRSVATAAFAEFADNLIQQNARDGLWDSKTQRQAKSISNLFIKFMLQDQNVHDLNALRQHHVGMFVDFMRAGVYRHYGKSPRDEDRTIAELRDLAMARDLSDRGIGPDTLNRHLTFLGQIFRHLAVRGVDALAAIEVAELRSKGKKGRARNERVKLPLDRAAAIFRAAPFDGYAAWDLSQEAKPDRPHEMFHCGLYFVPLLLYYTGCRREELCGLMVDDVILDKGEVPYIHVAKNQRRRIKNTQSQRNIPLHPEVLRLNFAAYVKAIKLLGYQLTFPDLCSPSSRSPLGDRFYKQFKPILKSVGLTETGLGSHAIRHLFGAQLKKKMVAEEDRADLLGHGGGSETSERYCEPHEIATLYQFVQKLPVVTTHLQPREIRLLPWVVEKKVAPFSQPSRSKR